MSSRVASAPTTWTKSKNQGTPIGSSKGRIDVMGRWKFAPHLAGTIRTIMIISMAVPELEPEPVDLLRRSLGVAPFSVLGGQHQVENLQLQRQGQEHEDPAL